MSELKPCPCPICGAELKIYSPEDWAPTFYDPDSGGDPYAANCDCGFSFQRNDYDYVEFIAALNRRAQPNEPLMCIYRTDAGTCAKFSDISVVSYCVEGPCADEALTNGDRISMTNAQKIRAMSDEELAEWMLKNISCDKEAHMCLPEMYKDSGKCNGNCRAGHLAYLRQPSEEG